jgi:hypothetical protein
MTTINTEAFRRIEADETGFSVTCTSSDSTLEVALNADERRALADALAPGRDFSGVDWKAMFEHEIRNRVAAVALLRRERDEALRKKGEAFDRAVRAERERDAAVARAEQAERELDALREEQWPRDAIEPGDDVVYLGNWHGSSPCPRGAVFTVRAVHEGSGRVSFDWPGVDGACVDLSRVRKVENRAEKAEQLIPAYAMLDVWGALGRDSIHFDDWYDERGYADAWAELAAAVREGRGDLDAARENAEHYQAMFDATERQCDEWKARATLAEQERENWRITAINRANPAVSRADIRKAIDTGIRGTTDGDLIDPDSDLPTGECVRLAIDAVCDLLGVEAEQDVDPFEEQTDALADILYGDELVTDQMRGVLERVVRAGMLLPEQEASSDEPHAPATEDVKRRWLEAHRVPASLGSEQIGHLRQQRLAEFDVWLAKVKADARDAVRHTHGGHAVIGMEHAIEQVANALHGDQCAEDPDPGERCNCGADDFYRQAEIVLDTLREAGLLAPAPLREEWGVQWDDHDIWGDMYNTRHEAETGAGDEGTPVHRYVSDWLPMDGAKGDGSADQ